MTSVPIGPIYGRYTRVGRPCTWVATGGPGAKRPEDEMYANCGKLRRAALRGGCCRAALPPHWCSTLVQGLRKRAFRHPPQVLKILRGIYPAPSMRYRRAHGHLPPIPLNSCASLRSRSPTAVHIQVVRWGQIQQQHKLASARVCKTAQGRVSDWLVNKRPLPLGRTASSGHSVIQMGATVQSDLRSDPIVSN